MERPNGEIDQVAFISLKKLVNERGHLLEVQRNDDRNFPGFGQAYLTATNPGIIKAWYRHHRQIDQIALAQGTLRLVLFDARDTSPTHGQVQEFLITDDQPALVRIPTGVWHGFQALGTTPALLLHLNTIPFSFQEIDEDRLPATSAEIPYRWAA